jgi:hypothetical protein
MNPYLNRWLVPALAFVLSNTPVMLSYLLFQKALFVAFWVAADAGCST